MMLAIQVPQVLSYSSKLGYNAPNNIKVSKRMYSTFTWPNSYNLFDRDDETQYFSFRNGGLAMSKKFLGQTSHRYTCLKKNYLIGYPDHQGGAQLFMGFLNILSYVTMTQVFQLVVVTLSHLLVLINKHFNLLAEKFA